MRPALDPCLIELARALSAADHARLGHIDATRILFVAGAARLESRASIRPLTFGGSPPRTSLGAFTKPRIAIDGVLMLYEVCLRPRFFLAATPEDRLAIIAHELWHASPAFDGTLANERRHALGASEAIEREVAEIVKKVKPSKAHDLLALKGELTMRAWLSRPPSRIPIDSGVRRDYGDQDLYETIIVQR